MKKLISLVILIFITLTIALSGCNNKNDLVTVRLNEVVHSIFYAPQYVALEKKFFEAQGLNIELTTGWGAEYIKQIN